MARRSTLHDVSKATGLSTFTVSRALSGGSGVSDASREEVVKAARLLGYGPNRAAQALRRASRDTIAVITADTSNSYHLDCSPACNRCCSPRNGRSSSPTSRRRDGTASPWRTRPSCASSSRGSPASSPP